MIFEDYLKRNAELYPEKTAVICGNNSLTYSQLWQEVLTKSANLPKNKAVAFRVSQDFESLFT